MKKVVRLTESDLRRIIKKVIKESSSLDYVKIVESCSLILTIPIIMLIPLGKLIVRALKP